MLVKVIPNIFGKKDIVAVVFEEKDPWKIIDYLLECNGAAETMKCCGCKNIVFEDDAKEWISCGICGEDICFKCRKRSGGKNVCPCCNEYLVA